MYYPTKNYMIMNFFLLWIKSPLLDFTSGLKIELNFKIDFANWKKQFLEQRPTRFDKKVMPHQLECII